MGAVWGLGNAEGGVGMGQASLCLSVARKAGLQPGVSWPGSSMSVFGANLETVLTPFSPNSVGLFN